MGEDGPYQASVWLVAWISAMVQITLCRFQAFSAVVLSEEVVGGWVGAGALGEEGVEKEKEKYKETKGGGGGEDETETEYMCVCVCVCVCV